MKPVKLLIALLMAGGISLLAGCEREGPAERTGRDVDRTTDEIRDDLREAGDELDDAAERTGDRLEETGRDMNRDLRDAVDD